MMKRLSRPLIIAILVTLIAGGLCGILLLYRQLSRVSEMDVLQSFRQAVEQAALNLDDRMAHAEETLRMLLYDARMQASLSRVPEEETLARQLREIKDLREMVYPAEKSRGIAQVRLYLSDQKMITREGINFFGLSEAEGIPEYPRVLTSKGSPVWIGAHEVRTRYFRDTCLTLGCVYRAYYAPEGRNWAVVLIDLSEDYLGGILSTLDLPDERARVVLADAAGAVQLGRGDPARLSGLLAQAEPWGFFTDPQGQELAYIVQPLQNADWSLVVHMPRASLLGSRQALRGGLTLLLFGLTLLMIAIIGGVICVLYAYRIRLYIRGMNENLKTAKEGEAPPAASPALFDLDRNIGELLDTNKRLTEETYQAQSREREVTLQALQAQINPHFLYNTLDSINWMALREGAEGVSDAIATLAEYFRLSLSRGRSIVTLREDIEIAQKYLNLYRHRYDYEYRVEWETQEDLLECAIPKLTLQPLIENALQHGIFQRSEKLGGVIRVTVSRRGDLLVLRVLDNGPGLRQEGEPPKGYGLTNVRERLELYFGGKYALRIENAPGGGAVVTVEVEVSDGREG